MCCVAPRRVEVLKGAQPEQVHHPHAGIPPPAPRTPDPDCNGPNPMLTAGANVDAINVQEIV